MTPDMHRLRALFAMLILALGLAIPSLARAQDAQTIVSQLAGANLRGLAEAVEALAASGDERALPILQALGEGDLYEAPDGGIYIRSGRGVITEAASGSTATDVTPDALRVIRINNSLRRDIRAAIGNLTLLSENPNTRLVAAREMFSSAVPSNIDLLDVAIAQEDN